MATIKASATWLQAAMCDLSDDGGRRYSRRRLERVIVAGGGCIERIDSRYVNPEGSVLLIAKNL
jgi:hypothetical protein